MLKFLAICFLAVLASVSAKPHLIATGVNYATPAVVTPVVAHPVVTHPVVAATAVHTPFIAAPAYYPHYAASYATYPSYAVYPHLGGAAYFVRR